MCSNTLLSRPNHTESSCKGTEDLQKCLQVRVHNPDCRPAINKISRHKSTTKIFSKSMTGLSSLDIRTVLKSHLRHPTNLKIVWWTEHCLVRSLWDCRLQSWTSWRNQQRKNTLNTILNKLATSASEECQIYKVWRLHTKNKKYCSGWKN